MTNKVILITGVAGLDSTYLAEPLLRKGHTDHGIERRLSSFNTGWIDYLYQAPHKSNARYFLHYCDMTDRPT